MTTDTNEPAPQENTKQIALSAVAEDFAVENKMLRDRLLLRSSHVDELRAVVAKQDAALAAANTAIDDLTAKLKAKKV